MKRLICTIIIACLFPVMTDARITQFRDIYFVTGVPLSAPVTAESIDIKFQVSIKTGELQAGKGAFFIAYTQWSVWNAYGISAPFHDNTYSPGVYYILRNDKNISLFGLEHMSNGRPYYGNKLAEPGYDDYSRGMNYFLYEQTWNRSSGKYTLKLKAGVGCGVGDYERHMKMFTQDLFLKYFGYATFKYENTWKRLNLQWAVTPIYNPSIANTELMLNYKLAESEKMPWLSLQFNYGYECMCDCVLGRMPQASIRIGLIFMQK